MFFIFQNKEVTDSPKRVKLAPSRSTKKDLELSWKKQDKYIDHLERKKQEMARDKQEMAKKLEEMARKLKEMADKNTVERPRNFIRSANTSLEKSDLETMLMEESETLVNQINSLGNLDNDLDTNGLQNMNTEAPLETEELRNIM